MFSKSVLRALAIDGGVGLDNPTRIVNLLEEFSQKTQEIRLVRNMSGGTAALAVLAGLSGVASFPLLAASLGLIGGALGIALRHGLSANDERELSLLQRHRSLIHALSEIDKVHGTEKTLCRYEELIATYSTMEDCFYFGQSRVAAAEITGFIEQAIATNATSIGGVVPQPQPVKPTQPTRFSLSQLKKTPALPATKTPAVAFTQPAPTQWTEVPTLIQPQAVEPEQVTTPAPVATQTTGDLARLMGQRLKSTIIAASPRGGKGIVVAHAGRELQRLRPEVEIWLLDPKDEPTERGYWSFIPLDKRLHFDLRNYSIDVARVQDLVDEFLGRFNNSTAIAKLLIVDEFVSLNARLSAEFMKRLKDFLVSISSSGEVGTGGHGRFAWIVTQSPYTVDIGFRTKGLMTSFNRAMLFSSSSTGFVDLGVTGNFCPALEMSKRVALVEPTSRAFYYSVGNTWASLAEYPTFEHDPKTSKLSHPFSYGRVQQAVQVTQPTEAKEAVSERHPQGNAPTQKPLDDVANKLLNWIKGTGQQYAVDECIPGAEILNRFRYSVDNKTCRLSKAELLELIRVLVNRNEVEVIKGQGVRLVTYVDEFGLFD